MNEQLSKHECASLLKLYEHVYAHPLLNDGCCTKFLKGVAWKILEGWLVEQKGNVVNWACYAFDITKEQMKRAKRLVPKPPSTSKRNNIETSFKHSSQPFQDPSNNTNDDDCFVVDEPKHLTVYFAKQLGVAKGLLEDTKTKENNFLPSKLEMYKEKLELLGRITKIQLA
jgi:hypothetical protein